MMRREDRSFFLAAFPFQVASSQQTGKRDWCMAGATVVMPKQKAIDSHGRQERAPSVSVLKAFPAETRSAHLLLRD